jgi:hypothetical protein
LTPPPPKSSPLPFWMFFYRTRWLLTWKWTAPFHSWLRQLISH